MIGALVLVLGLILGVFAWTIKGEPETFEGLI